MKPVISKLRLKPNTQESSYIKYLLNLEGFSFFAVGKGLSINGETVLNVVAGRRRSRKVEAEIARILGKPSWNDLVIEARLFVSNPAFRPTQKDIDEYKNVLTLKLKEIENRKTKIREELAPMREAVQAIRRGR
ncbi:hypothetical protein E4N85_10300 [Treponema denticola]|uniref:hypothetical protein n=1 Tax=Treponema denticola TaxID=158 RepID=UPI0020A59A0D|nr:hypothetical protein [Treponema denticola]UTC96099.1 hypothetical protein E4N85_10300 [Treponema denticola]